MMCREDLERLIEENVGMVPLGQSGFITQVFWEHICLEFYVLRCIRPI